MTLLTLGAARGEKSPLTEFVCVCALCKELFIKVRDYSILQPWSIISSKLAQSSFFLKIKRFKSLLSVQSLFPDNYLQEV